MKKATTTTTAAKKTTTASSTATKPAATASKPAATASKSTASSTSKPAATKTGSTTSKSTTSASKSKSDQKQTTSKPTQDTKKIEEVKKTEEQTKEKPVEIQNQQQQLQVEPKQEEQKVQVQEIIHGEVIITYSHYKNKFPTQNGQITSSIIDDEYCLSSVFLGNFKMHLLDDTKKKVEEKIGSVSTFFGLVSGKSYALQIEEDDKAEAQRESKAFVAEKKDDKLRGERKEGCSCIYGNPCVDSGICNDWKNRYDVAKKNGWKGFS